MVSCAIFGVAVNAIIVVNMTFMFNMSSQECHAYTVLKKLAIRGMIKEEACRILVAGNRKRTYIDSENFNFLGKVKNFLNILPTWLI